MSEVSKEIKDILFDCPTATTQVHLKVKGEFTKGFFGKKFVTQKVGKCDLQSQGGCTVKIDTPATSKCPAVIKALKCSLKI
ncbi:MAG: hypothetical protein AABZ74_16490 [Cyanobacteriota bacterium]